MATIQTAWADGRDTAPAPKTAGAVHTARFVLDLSTAGVGAGDVVEIGLLQPFAVVTDAVLVPEGAFAGITAQVGLMSGTAGDPDAVRTVGTEIFAAATALTGAVRASATTAFTMTPTEATRGIGVQFSGAVAAGAGKKLTLVLSYMQ